MKRRDFLKILGIAPAITAVPALAKTDKLNNMLKDAKTLQSFPEGWLAPIKWISREEAKEMYPPKNIYIFGESTTEIEYSDGDVVISANGKKYKAVITSNNADAGIYK